MLRAKGIHFTALDKSVAQVDFVKRFGNKIYYGDATRIDLGVHVIRRETFHSSLDFTREVLEDLGLPSSRAQQAVEMFREHDRKRLFDDYKIASDEEKMRERTRQSNEELEELFRRDLADEEAS